MWLHGSVWAGELGNGGVSWSGTGQDPEFI